LENSGKNTVQLAKGFFKKYNVVEIAAADFARVQTVSNCVFREAGIVLQSRKTLFFGRRY